MLNRWRPASALLTLVLLAGCGAGTSESAGPEAESAPAATQTADTPDAGASVPATTEPDTSVRDAWAANAVEHRGEDGERFEYSCPPDGEFDTVWGTDTYTDDSSVCTAAVHVGVITREDGGTVTIEIAPGEDAYEASERNGVATQSYPAWGGSFVVLDE